jgi:hypothetical protein
MYESKYLIENQFALLSCKQFAETRVSLNFSNIQNYTQQQFIDLFDSRLKSLKHSKIIGLEDFSHKDAIIGCNHFIDNVLLQYTITGIQTFEHDYRYYKKLHPNIIFATVETLQKDKPLLIAAPFPGHLGLHRQWNDIISRCEELKIPVYIDGAWFPPSFDITLDLSSPCIKEIAFSCSKAYGLGDNRIGVRYSRSKNSNDSITHMNERQMISHTSYQIACKFLERFEYDHIVSLYKKDYLDMCKQLKLRPSNIINSAFSIDWRKLYGVSKVLPVL